MSKLNWKLLTKKRASSTRGIPPGKEDLAWVTNTVTLISGERDAVLVDTFLSDTHSRELVEWVAESGKNLTTIFVTHGHGDHFFGIQRLLDRFPAARAVSTAHVAAAIREQIQPDFMRTVWEPRFPGQIPPKLAAPAVLEGDTITLEGEIFEVLELGHTDTAHSAGLHVPSLALVVSGDTVYNNTHPYLAENNVETIREWLAALDQIEALHPKAVVAGHGVTDPDSSPRHIAETRQYLRDFLASVATSPTASDLYQKMLSLYPNRVNPGSLWAASLSFKPVRQVER